MRNMFTLLAAGVAIPWAGAAPLPPSVEQLNKEGISVTEKAEAKIQTSLGKQSDGVHLFKLQKDQTYGIDLTSSEFKGRIRIEGLQIKMSPIMSDNGKASFRAPNDGTYKLTITANGGGSGGKYSLSVQQFGINKFRPGVLYPDHAGVSVNSSIVDGDPQDPGRRNYRSKSFEVQFAAGKTYTIDMISGEFDSYLRLEDPNKKNIAEDDDGGGYPNARITLQAPLDGMYRIIATSFNGGGGNFTLKVRKH